MCQAAALPTSPSHASGVGPSLSPLKGGEGLFDRFLFDNSVPYIVRSQALRQDRTRAI
jgi:hypothetical protein